MVRPAPRAEAAAHDPGVVVEEDRAAERLLVHERPELDLDPELLHRLPPGRLLGGLAVLDAAAREEVVGVPVAHTPDESDLAVLDEDDPCPGEEHLHSSRNASSAAQRGSATASSWA